MFYPEDLIEEIRSKNDIVEVISSYMKLQRKGANYTGVCPFHNEKTASFMVSPSKQIFRCFGCGVGGDVYSFIRKYENIDFKEAIKVLAERAGVSLPEKEYSEEERKSLELRNLLLEINSKVARFYYHKIMQLPNAGMAYFEKRKLNNDTIRNFALGFSGNIRGELHKYLKGLGYSDEILKQTGLVKFSEKGTYDTFWNRVIFPIIDVHRNVIGFGGRILGEGNPKYLNSSESIIFKKGQNLYGLNFAKSSSEDYFLLCEGYMDVIALHQAGFKNAIASLGTALTLGHVRLIKKYKQKIIITYDSDNAGVNAAKKAIPILRELGISVRVLNMKPFKDPDEFIVNLGKEKFLERIENAKNAFLWEIDILKTDYNLIDPEQKTLFYREIADRLLLFDENFERENYMQSVCKEQNISYEYMKNLIDLKQGNKKDISVNKNVANKNISQNKNISPNKSTSNNKLSAKEKEILKSQGFIISMLSEDISLYESIKKNISPEEFINDYYIEVLTKIYKLYENGKTEVGSIINDYIEDEKMQNFVTKLLSIGLSESVGENHKRMLEESIFTVKLYYLDRERIKAAKSSDMSRLQEITLSQQELKKKGIHLE
jgi:hypothetical protein